MLLRFCANLQRKLVIIEYRCRTVDIMSRPLCCLRNCMLLLVSFVAMTTARHRIGEKSTLIQRFHSRQVASCRRRGNLFAWYPPLQRCMPLLEESSACKGVGEVLVLNSTTLEAQCMSLPCDVTHVLRPDGLCHTKEDFCSHAEDKELVLKESGYGTCDCPDLHVYWTPTDRCFIAYTQGPCADGEYIIFRENIGVLCERNPCARDQVQWRNKCVPRVGHGCLDSVHGHLLLNPANLQYECTLRCPDGMVELGLECYYLYSRGPCPDGQHVVQRMHSRYGECAQNPCGGDGLLQWKGKCWHRGQYCSNDGELGFLGPSSEVKQPQKREPLPVVLPHDEHFTILGVEDLRESQPVPIPPKQQGSGSAPPLRRPPVPDAPTMGPVTSFVTGTREKTPSYPAVTDGSQTTPAPYRGRPRQEISAAEGPESYRPEDIPIHHSVVSAPPHLMNFANVEQSSSTSAIFPARQQHTGNNHGLRPFTTSSLQSSKTLDSDYKTPQSSFSSNIGQGPSYHLFLPPTARPGELQGQICGTHRSQVAPPPGFVNGVPSEEVKPSLPLSGALMLSMIPPPRTQATLNAPHSSRPQQIPFVNQNLNSKENTRLETEYPDQTPLFADTSALAAPGMHRLRPHGTQSPTTERVLPLAGPQYSGFPSIPQGYLPPPPSSGRRRRHASYSFSQLQRLLEVGSLQPQGSKVVETRVPPPGYLMSESEPQGASSQPRPQVLGTSTAARLDELQSQHGFHTIDEEHPFSGGFESTSEVHGLHISVNPLTNEVECSDAIGFYRTISFAHYKCRPGSRRDQLGECHHESPGWTDFHPDRCPFGMQHNLLTGKCVRFR